ncbi:MAG: M16 family metallopeptidase [Lepagella sp.]
MIKKFLSLAVVAFGALFASAQQALPLDPAVKHGTLPNGLNYYIMHNEEPKERAHFYIAQQVGSSLETPEQLGLAHFLEHMAFNGTTNFPGKAMLEYLQSKGIRFGADINAYTGFDETVYHIANVPTTDVALMDSVLLAIHDWSCAITLDAKEIDNERGVIEEEWRSRNDAMYRMYEAILPVVYQEYQYRQMPIGKMEVVKNFPPQAIRDYYQKWYRPDLQGIVVIGDFDAAEMEQKVIKLFSEIEAQKNPAPRTYTSISDNKEPIYAFYSDKEFPVNIGWVMFKSEPFPREYRNTAEYMMFNDFLQPMICKMIDNRLEEYAKDPNCQYVQAGVDFSQYFVSKTKDAFAVQVIGKNDMNAAIRDAMSIVARACKTGFTISELTRAKDEIMADIEKAYNEKDKTDSRKLAPEIYRHFIDNEPCPGIAIKYQVAQQILPALDVNAINEAAKQILTTDNQVIVIGQPDNETAVVPVKEEVIKTVNDALKAEYEAYVDEVITDPLIENLPAPGKIVSCKESKFGTTEIELSNGAKVVLKPTDFKEDEILVSINGAGGKQAYTADQAADVQAAEALFDDFKQGNFNAIKLQKYLAGKNVSLSYNVGNKATGFDGKSTKKDLKTLFELIYSAFVQTNPDKEACQVDIEKIKNFLASQDKNPQQVYSKMISNACYGGNPLYAQMSVEMLDQIDLDKTYDIIKKSLANARDFTFVFTGNVDLETIRPLLEQYIATLPAADKASAVEAKSSICKVEGQVNEHKTMPMAAPSTMVFVNVIDNNIPYTLENAVKVNMVGEILSNIFTDTLREEEGGSYSPYAYSFMNHVTGYWEIVYVFQTNDQIQDKMMNRANEELMKLLKNGASQAHFTKVKEAALKQYDNKIRTNEYWLRSLDKYYLFGIDDLTNGKEAIEKVTLDDLNKFMSTLYDGKNQIKVVLQGVKE